MEDLNKIICYFKRHKRGKTFYKGKGYWHIEWERCGYILEYKSPHVRLVSSEMRFGFDGE